jgi:iron complex transport system substrate-binding protein
LASIRRGALLATAAAVIIGGCGASSTSPTEIGHERQSSSAFPVTVRDATRAVTVARRPQRIVSLSPSATETLFAVGAGDQVVAVDDQSDHPADAPTTDLSSYQPNLEAIAAHRPDLVVVPADVPRDVISGLRRLELTVLAEPAPETLDDAYRQIRDLGAVTGHRDAGKRVARDVRSAVDRLIASAPDGPSQTVFHELDPDLYSVGSQTFLGRIYARLGLRNVADRAAKRAKTPYPQMSSEAVVAADPDLIVLADSECCGQTLSTVRQRPGWDAISAVRNDRVVAIDDDVASRWGPRIPVFVAEVVRAMRTAGSAGRREE